MIRVEFTQPRAHDLCTRLHGALPGDDEDDEDVADDAEHEDDRVEGDDQHADPCLVDQVLQIE